ncbi:MAG: ferrous iron transport protein B [Planctomycetota bacterium]|nr:ferrous iron transport protein B [Planctomycetota bacterium]
MKADQDSSENLKGSSAAVLKVLDLAEPKRVALIGNPNAGKTTLFNSLTGLRARTANFPGTTVDYREAAIEVSGTTVSLVDLPGAYSLHPSSPEEEVTADFVSGGPADLLLVVVDATNLERNLLLVSELLERELPVVVALNMIDRAERQGIRIDADELGRELKCPVVVVSARTGNGIEELRKMVARQVSKGCESVVNQDLCGGCQGCQFAARLDWAEGVVRRTSEGQGERLTDRTRAIDRFVTHPVLGLVLFALIGVVIFMLIFWFAAFPMDAMDALFGWAQATVGSLIPPGDFNGLITDGIIGGVGGMLIFLPQIMLLFFMISLLEDSGYLARAAFVMDRVLYHVGLPGKAFVPMLSAHACAIPAVMASKVIDDWRDRLKTILILPLMTCSARLPVYAMVVAILFPQQPVWAALTFAAAYSLGILMAILMAFLLKVSLLPGPTRHLVIELPPYRFPSFRNALFASFDRGKIFVKKAGTVILLFSITLWILATYPKTEEDKLVGSQATRLAQLQELDGRDPAGDSDLAGRYLATLESENSFAGRIGKTIQPVFAPLGFDWRTTVGVLNSFAAREVVVSTLAILYGADEDDEGQLTTSLKNAKDEEGSPVFTVPTCLSLLVFFVLAMQCLPTTAVVKRETGGWKWPLFQLVSMTLLAYGMAFLTYQLSSLFV